VWTDDVAPENRSLRTEEPRSNLLQERGPRTVTCRSGRAAEARPETASVVPQALIELSVDLAADAAPEPVDEVAQVAPVGKVGGAQVAARRIAPPRSTGDVEKAGGGTSSFTPGAG